ncbi:hypothetical protein Verru16b_02838 [Lacunisphaera limnophila]|uniref:Methyltransferase FkbM domain-containing protein n=1 Tax=Lacunisphaera limnophila TaxID=1838286 RepID=A0A1D8AXZ3_9BACT|nr:FkbM family methyltransferase [Lacunisphaera limnophila]AOS45751.1 hypothetical protein Verru16b_02838 [Lacunisphaera limnophila]
MSLRSTAKSVLRDLLPPVLLRALRPAPPVASQSPDAQEALSDEFYRTFLPAGSLCFDIGANVGNRLASFRRLGCRVVAAEPQPACQQVLRTRFDSDPLVHLVPSAIGRQPGTAEMQVSDLSVLSSLSPEFIAATTRSGRFAGIRWDQRLTVELTTLDALIAAHGRPHFIKIDVEGYEHEVLLGLSQPVNLVAIEWAPEVSTTTLQCLDHLARLGPVSFNLSWGESMRFARQRWLNHAEITTLINQFSEETYLFADIYIRNQPA